MEQNPTRSWAIILQQAWSLCLKDKINFSARSHQDNNKTDHRERKPKPCYKYNKGKCTYGLNCKFKHKCLVCSKFGHGVHNCRKLHGSGSNDKEHVKNEKK